MTLLLFGAPEHHTDLFAAVPAPIGDPFLVLLRDEGDVAVVGSLDADNVLAARPGIEIRDPQTYGMRRLVVDGMQRPFADAEVARRALEDLGVGAVTVNWDLPVAIADALRAGGVELTVDPLAFEALRRVKTPVQLEGHRRAQRAAEAAMDAIATLLREAPDGLTAEQARAAGQAAADALGADLGDEAIVAPGAQGASGHDSGNGPILAGDVVIVDLWPRDRASRCYADMTRTFVAGGAQPPDEIAEFHRLCREALQRVTESARAGIDSRELHAICSEVFEQAGQPTQRTAPEGSVLRDGFFHGLGHGVGLDVHEAPAVGLAGAPLLAGEVIAVEPGCYRHGVGGVRLEDLLLITEDGCEVLTQFPYDL